MQQFIGCDAHKTYSVFVAVNERGEFSSHVRVGHDRESYKRFLKALPHGSQIALEASGHYYWIVDEMEAAGTARTWHIRWRPRSEWGRRARRRIKSMPAA